MKQPKHIWNIQNTIDETTETHLERAKHIWNIQNTIETTETHLEQAKHIWNIQNTIGTTKTHLEHSKHNNTRLGGLGTNTLVTAFPTLRRLIYLYNLHHVFKI